MGLAVISGVREMPVSLDLGPKRRFTGVPFSSWYGGVGASPSAPTDASLIR